MVDPGHIKALEEVVAKLKEDPSILYEPKLAFFKEFLESWGAKIPAAGTGAKSPKGEAPSSSGPQKIDPEPEEPEEEEEEEEPEEPEEDDPERLPPDSEPFPGRGPPGEKELTDAEMDKQGELKQAAAEALEDGDVQKALDKFTEAIMIGNCTAMMYAKRAEILLKLKRPNACIADCTAALEINPDSGKAYRIRGKAHRRLGHWEEAHSDLSKGQQIDFDDDTMEVEKLVAEKWKKIEERKTRQRIKAEAKAKKQKEADFRRRKAEAKRAYEEATKAESSGGYPGGMPGGFPGGFPGGMPGGFPGGMPGGMGGMPGGMPGMPPGMDPSMLAGLMSDPELMAAFSNPKMAAAMQDIMQNPGNIGKYQSDPEIMGLMQKVMGKMGGMGGMPGGMPGGFPGGMPGGMGGGGDGGGATVEEVPESGDANEVD